MKYDNSCERLVKRYQVLKGGRTVVESLWYKIEQFITPFRGQFYRDNTNENSVDWENNQIFDSTALNAARSLAASIGGNLTNPYVQWFGLRYRDETLNDNKDAAKWLEDSADRVFQALNDSDFNLEANETYLDLTTYGTSVLIEEEKDLVDGEWDGIDFSSTPIRDCFFEEDYDGTVLRFFRRHMFSPAQMVSKFGEEAVPEDVRQAANSPEKADIKEEVVFVVYPRKASAKKGQTTKLLAANLRPFGGKYIRISDATMLGEEKGYYEMPAFVPRWLKTNDSMWGNSPAMIAIYDVMSLNAMEDLVLSYMAKTVDDVYIGTERGLLGDLELKPGSYNILGDMNEFGVLPSNARFNEAMAERDYKRASINRIFFQDQLQLKESPAMTATEVQVRYELMQRLLGPTLSRMQTDFLDPLIQRTFNILYRAGQLDDLPDVVAQSGSELDIEYVGPMARAQRVDQVANIERWIGALGGMAELNPEVLDIPDWDRVSRETGKMLGVPADVISSEAEVQQQRDERAAQQQQMAEMAQAEQAGNVLKATGEGMQAIEGAGGAPDLTAVTGGIGGQETG